MGNEQTSIPSGTTLTEAEKKGLLSVECTKCNEKKAASIRIKCLKCKGEAVTVAADVHLFYENFDTIQLHGRCFNCKNKKDAQLEYVVQCSSCRTGNLPLVTECAICFCDYKRNVETVALKCGHHFCQQCFGMYFTTSIRESKLIETQELGCYSLKCPESGCNEYVEDVHFIKPLVSRAEYELFKDITFNMYNTKNDAVHCPSTKCGAIMIPKSIADIKVQCWNCKECFCKNCHSSWHENKTCSQYRLALEPDLAKALEQNAMSCPSCKQVITKVLGTCNHMKCTCGTNFCFRCGREWPTNALEKRGIKVHALGIGKKCNCPLWGAK